MWRHQTGGFRRMTMYLIKKQHCGRIYFDRLAHVVPIDIRRIWYRSTNFSLGNFVVWVSRGRGNRLSIPPESHSKWKKKGEKMRQHFHLICLSLALRSTSSSSGAARSTSLSLSLSLTFIACDSDLQASRVNTYSHAEDGMPEDSFVRRLSLSFHSDCLLMRID